MSTTTNQPTIKSTEFHQGNGWNYGFKKQKDGRVRAYRYHTNGHQNTKKDFAPWLVALSDVPTTHKECESLFHAPNSGWGECEYIGQK